MGDLWPYYESHYMPSIEYHSLFGRQVILASCDASNFYIKNEFQSSFRKIPSDNLLENLPGDKISKTRTVVLGTFNCSIFSAFGPLVQGIPEWIDGVEMLGVTSVLNSYGLKWKIYAIDGFGKVHPDGSLEKGKFRWTIKKGLVDIGFCSFWHNTAIIGDVVNPWQRSCSRHLVPRIEHSSPGWHWHTVFHSLPFEFWVILGFCYFATYGALALLDWLLPVNKTKNKDSWGENWFLVLSFITQGMGNDGRAYKKWQIIKFAWGLFIVVASAAYSSSLVSILTTPIEDETPQTLLELLNEGFVWVSGIGPLDNPEYHFRTQSGLDKEWLKVQKTGLYIRKGKTAVLGEELNGVFIMPKAPEFSKEFLKSLMVSKECLAVNHVSILTRKMSPYYEFIASGFTRLAETGVLNKILQDSLSSPRISRFITKEIYNMDDLYERGKPLDWAPVRGAFYMLFSGLMLAFACFLIEIVKATKISNRKTNSQKFILLN